MAVCERPQRRLRIEVEEQAPSVAHQGSDIPPVAQAEVWNAAPDQRMPVANVVAEADTPDALGEVGRAVRLKKGEIIRYIEEKSGKADEGKGNPGKGASGKAA